MPYNSLIINQIQITFLHIFPTLYFLSFLFERNRSRDVYRKPVFSRI